MSVPITSETSSIRMNPPVFYFAAAFILVFGLVVIAMPAAAGEWLLAALHSAHEKGVVLAAISQCPSGHVEFGVYAAGSALAGCGLVSGGGMTREAALGKLFSLLGSGLCQQECERLFALDLCGELLEG